MPLIRGKSGASRRNCDGYCKTDADEDILLGRVGYPNNNSDHLPVAV